MTISSWLNFGRPASPGRGSAAGRKIFGFALLQPARSVCISLSAFFYLACIHRLLLVFFCVVFCYMFMCVSCFGLVANWLARKTPLMTLLCCYLHKAQVKKITCVQFFFHLICLCCYVFFPTLHYVFHTPVAWYRLFVLKVSLNTNKPNKSVVMLRNWLVVWSVL